DIELRRGAGVEPLLDQSENPVGYIEVVPRNPQPVLRRKHLEIGVAYGYDGRQNDDFLVEAAGDGAFLRRARVSAVLSPKIDLIPRIERGMEEVPLGQAGVLKALRKADEIDFRQQRRADDLGLRVRLQDAPDGGGNVEIGDLRLLDQIGEFARTKAAPPIERRRCGLPLPGAVFGRDIGRELRSRGLENAPGQHWHET